MSRGILMVLLALDLFVMGTSAYVLFDRIRKHIITSNAVSPLNVPAQAIQPRVHDQPLSEQQNPAASAQEDSYQKEEPQPQEQPLQEEKKEPLRKVIFKYRDSVPRRVSIAGDFNDWSPQLMQKDKHSNWTIVLKLKPGEYAYNFIVDGKMIRDPSNRKIKKAGQKIPSSVLALKHK